MQMTGSRMAAWDCNPVNLDLCMQHELQIADACCTENRMIINADKRHAMVLGSTDHHFSFTTKDSLNLLGMNINNQLNFNKQVSLICEKVHNQLNIMKRFSKLVSTSTTLKFFIRPLFCHIFNIFCSMELL